MLLTAKHMIIGDGQTVLENGALCINEKGKICAVLFLLVAVFTVIDGGIGIGEMLKTKKIDWVSLASLFTAIYFAISCVFLFKNTKSKIVSLFGFFPPIYICARGIELYFESFKSINKITMRVEVLTVCALAFFIMSFILAYESATVSAKRLKVSAMIFCVFAGAFILPELYAVLTVFGDKTPYIPKIFWCLQVLIYQIIAFATLSKVRTFTKKQKADEQTETPDEPDSEIELDEQTKEKLDVFLKDIPAENDNQEE